MCSMTCEQITVPKRPADTGMSLRPMISLFAAFSTK